MMNPEKLVRTTAALHIGGARRKKAVHKTTTTDDEGLESTLKRVNPIPASVRRKNKAEQKARDNALQSSLKRAEQFREQGTRTAAAGLQFKPIPVIVSALGFKVYGMVEDPEAAHNSCRSAALEDLSTIYSSESAEKISEPAKVRRCIFQLIADRLTPEEQMIPELALALREERARQEVAARAAEEKGDGQALTSHDAIMTENVNTGALLEETLAMMDEDDAALLKEALAISRYQQRELAEAALQMSTQGTSEDPTDQGGNGSNVPSIYPIITEDISERLTLKQKALPQTDWLVLSKYKPKEAFVGGVPIQFKIQGFMEGLSKFCLDEYEIVVYFKDRRNTFVEVRIQRDILERQIGLSPKQLDGIFSSSVGEEMRKIMQEYMDIWTSLSATLIIEMKKLDSGSDSYIPTAVEVDSTWDFDL